MLSDSEPVLKRQRSAYWLLFAFGDQYAYSSGVNWRAIAALVLAVAPVVPGFLRAATTPGGQVATPTAFDTLYTYAWFVTFAIGFVAYYILMRSHRSLTLPVSRV